VEILSILSLCLQLSITLYILSFLMIVFPPSDYMKHEPCKQEFSDWPQALLAIGTFGSNSMKEDSGGRSNNNTVEDSSSFKDCTQEITLEEVANLQNEFSIFFKGRVEPNLGGEQEEHANDLTKDCLNSEHSRLDSEGKENESLSDANNRGDFYPSKSIVFSRGKDYCLDHSSKRGVGKKSLSFLLKKMLACKSGFQPTPLFKDPLSTESRMEKVDQKPCKSPYNHSFNFLTLIL